VAAPTSRAAPRARHGGGNEEPGQREEAGRRRRIRGKVLPRATGGLGQLAAPASPASAAALRAGQGGGNQEPGRSAKKGEIPQELTLDSSSPPVVPAHQSASELVIPASQTKNGSKKRRRRPRTKNPTAANPSPSQQPDGLIEPAAVVVAAHEPTPDAPAPAVVAETDTEGRQQDAPKKRHGGGTERAAQELALEPIIIEHDALRPTIAEQQRAPNATVDEPRPASALDAVPTPKPRVGAVCPDPDPSNGWLKPKKPRARWTPVPPPPRLPRPTPARRASPPARPTRPPAFVLQVQSLILL
jgi:hypothetical protein